MQFYPLSCYSIGIGRGRRNFAFLIANLNLNRSVFADANHRGNNGDELRASGKIARHYL